MHMWTILSVKGMANMRLTWVSCECDVMANTLSSAIAGWIDKRQGECKGVLSSKC